MTINPTQDKLETIHVGFDSGDEECSRTFFVTPDHEKRGKSCPGSNNLTPLTGLELVPGLPKRESEQSSAPRGHRCNGCGKFFPI